MNREVIMDGEKIALIQNLSELEMDDTLLYDDEETRDLSDELEKTKELIGENDE